MDFELQRQEMVERQIEARGVKAPRVLEAMRRVPRELFVPESELARSCIDAPLPIGHGQTISQPYIVAVMTEWLQLEGHERVLEIGTGSGYQTAVLAQIAASVYTVEIIPELATRSRRLLQQELHYENIHFHLGQGRLGWPQEAPFDRILVTAAAPDIPEALTQQLLDGGVLVIPVGSSWQSLTRFRRRDSLLHSESTMAVTFVPLV